MGTEVVIPQMGESIAEATITKWLVEPGDTVERDQPLLEISTDKVDAEVPSPAAGVLLEIRSQAGETVPVDQVVALIGEEGEEPAAAEPDEEPDEKPEERAEPVDQEAPPAPPESEPRVAVEDADVEAEGEYDRDLIVIGSGPGGYVAAIRAGQLGLASTLVEKDEDLGGTCTLRGCIPTKALLHTAELLDRSREADTFGVRLGDPELDMGQAHEHKRGVVQKNSKGIAYLLEKNDVERLHGTARLGGPHQVVVSGADGESRLSARYILIATGSVPTALSIAATDGKRILDSDQILELEEVPGRLAVLGSGAVGTEFASLFASFGSEVALIEMLPAILPNEDEEISAQLQKSLQKRGIDCRPGTRLTAVDDSGEALVLSLETDDGETEALETDVLLVAVGRSAVVEGLGFEEQGVEVRDGFIQVNQLRQTATAHIYAIGDVTSSPALAHVASAEGLVAVEHMAGQEPRPLDYDKVPSCTYCDPEVASVGLTEQEAEERGYEVEVGKFPFSALGKARILGQTEGFCKVVRETRYDEVLGVHIVGPHATDLIAEACAALQLETTNEEIVRTVHAHPTLSEIVAEAAHAAAGAALHI